MAVPILHLMQDRPPPVTIAPHATLRSAMEVMLEHDYTQLPVVEDGLPFGNPPCFVTSNSIARAVSIFGTSMDELHVRDALVPARTLSVDEDLFSKMDDLLDSYAVLVLAPNGTLAGIVTNYDTTQYFRRRAEDVLLVEDIETTLKDYIRLAYGGADDDPQGPLQAAINALGGPLDSVKDACRKSFRKFCGTRSLAIDESDVAAYVDVPFEAKRGGRGFDDLSLSEYIQLARRPEAWKRLESIFGIGDAAFLRMMEGVRITRNKLMHFRPDITAVERDQLRFCAEWFKNHPPLTSDEVSPATPEMVNAPSQTTVSDTQLVAYIEDPSSEGLGDSAEVAAVDSKYAPLASFLARQPRNLDRVALTFADVERIIGAPLPAAARDHRAWWANNATSHVQAEQWLKVNWRVASINMSLQRVIFARARDREQAYIRFFSQVQDRLHAVPDFPLHPASPLGQNWLPLVMYPETGRTLVLSFARGQRLRLECYIDTGDAEQNERIFEAMLRERNTVESLLGTPAEWERLEGKRACRVAIYVAGAITEADRWDAFSDWAVGYAPRFHEAITRRTLSASVPEGPGRSS